MQLMDLVDALEMQRRASRATAANLLTALVAELTAAPGPFPSANGAPHSSPGQRPGENARKTNQGLKAWPNMPTTISFAGLGHRGSRFQRSGMLFAP